MDRFLWPANYNNNAGTAYFIIGYSRIETSGVKKIICSIGIVCPHMFIAWYCRFMGSSTWLKYIFIFKQSIKDEAVQIIAPLPRR